MVRKTIAVRTVVSHINGMLSTPSIETEALPALCSLAERILFETDNYKGFAYVHPGGEAVSAKDVRDGNYLTYRRRYYIPEE